MNRPPIVPWRGRPETIPPEVGAGDLLLLLARREALELMQGEGQVEPEAVTRWLETLTTSERVELGRFDSLVNANRMHLRVQRRARGV